MSMHLSKSTLIDFHFRIHFNKDHCNFYTTLISIFMVVICVICLVVLLFSSNNVTFLQSFLLRKLADACHLGGLLFWEALRRSLGLLICMFGGVMYQQSTSNNPKAVKDVNPQAAEEEQQKLLEMQSSIQSTENKKQATQPEDEKQ